MNSALDMSSFAGLPEHHCLKMFRVNGPPPRSLGAALSIAKCPFRLHSLVPQRGSNTYAFFSRIMPGGMVDALGFQPQDIILSLCADL